MQVITKTRTFLLYFFNISIIIINMITTIIDIFQYDYDLQPTRILGYAGRDLL